jgi:hypothetical protein
MAVGSRRGCCSQRPEQTRRVDCHRSEVAQRDGEGLCMQAPVWMKSSRIVVVEARCSCIVDEADRAEAEPGGPAEMPLWKQRPLQSQLDYRRTSEGEVDKDKVLHICSHKMGPMCGAISQRTRPSAIYISRAQLPALALVESTVGKVRFTSPIQHHVREPQPYLQQPRPPD